MFTYSEVQNGVQLSFLAFLQGDIEKFKDLTEKACRAMIEHKTGLYDSDREADDELLEEHINKALSIYQVDHKLAFIKPYISDYGDGDYSVLFVLEGTGDHLFEIEGKFINENGMAKFRIY